AVEEPRDARGGQEDGAGQIDAAKRLVGCEVELDEDVEVVEREAVLRLETRRELARHGRMCAQEADPRLQLGFGRSLRSQYLTRQVFSAKIVDGSSIQILLQEAMITWQSSRTRGSSHRRAHGRRTRFIRRSRSRSATRV